VRRKTKRERRLEKLQAKVDRRERIEQEIQEAQAKAETGEAVFIREGISVKELADKLGVKVKDIIAKLMMRGILVTINQPLDKEVAVQVSSMFGFAAEIISFEDELVLEQEDVPEEQKLPRAPVVTVMGHVDHGKSSLLEAIHDVDITSKEHGGITQHIGAYRVRHKEREYVFLDTPGHEAFTLMRARGAQVTDVVVLVVAADDGVMPQTVEAINHCKAANVPMVVAINKMDKPGADPMRVKQDLMQHGILTEEFGGETVSVPISAKTRMGIEELLEMVAIVSDMLQLEASPSQLASGTVLESKLDKARGSVATVLIQDGSLKVGDLFLCGSTFGHVRGLFDDKGERVDHAGPSTPVEILGFSEVPAVGALFQGMSDEAKARQIASFRKEQDKAKQLRTGRVRLENVFGAIQQGEIQELPLILKADVHGSLEAVAQQVRDLSTEEVKVNVVHQGVGAVSESDVLLASASNALIIGFNVRPERKAVELAKNESVEIHSFTVIYDLIDRLKQALTGMLKPIEQEVILGHADVKEIFKVSKVGTVAGCIVADGRIPRTAQVRVLRDNVVVFTGRLGSLKRFKDDASEVKEGTECGIGIENYNDVKPGDVLEAFEIQVQERTLGDK
jgi:translation initiation factor IF-2